MKLKDNNNIFCAVSAGYSSIIMATKLKEWYPNHNIIYGMANTSKEDENFLNCDYCCEIIECAVIWDEQELDEWINCDSENWIRCKNEPYHYYQISKILEETYGATEEFSEKCYLIAKSVLKHWL